MSVNYTQRFDEFLKDISTSMKKGMTDIKYDGTRVMRGSAPKKTGQLEKGITGELRTSPSDITITWGAVARGSNGFNYAVPMHDNTYSLGQQSQMKPSVMSGIGTASFTVGNGYMSRPLETLEEPYIKYLDDKMKGVCTKYD